MAARRQILASLTLATPFLLTARRGRAQSSSAWPQRPVRLIVPFAPGGSVDGMARILAQRLQETLGQAFVVENRSGASGAVGGTYVARGEADGHTLLFSASIQAVQRLVLKNPGYDPLTDLRPVVRVGQAPVLLLTSKDRPEKTIAEVVAAARANPRRWSFGTGALGSAGHLATVEFIRQLGVDIPVVPYRGTAPALADLMAGTIGLLFDPVLATLPPVLGGQAQGLTISSAARNPAVPQIPTTAEAGFPTVDIQTWWAIWGPRDLPDAVAEKLSSALATILPDPALRARVATLGIETLHQDGPALDAFIRQEYGRTQELLRLAGFEPE
ncbi:tripartite tricarboxylate transporter substrate binding protein [Roseomonas sp. 18066]|uniref:Bug family tripartite tricarboxylate transporter substrate binding protein n=1 Tax=Roseomonas sp. 18066 TaxID=2681412 RepID=UPI001359A6CB|nr:tripartite tricarboxylate transporter substrate binding protein [Roseomonas sp. 18066]